MEPKVSPDRASIVQEMGIRFAEPPDDALVRFEIDLAERVRNPAGALQGGVVATLVDVAGGAAAAEVMGRHDITSVNLVVNYLHAARGGPIVADARMLRAGRTSAVAEVRVLDLGQDGRLVTFGTVTLQVLGTTPPAQQPDWADAIATRRQEAEPEGRSGDEGERSGI